jgi:hypothetical protein
MMIISSGLIFLHFLTAFVQIRGLYRGFSASLLLTSHGRYVFLFFFSVLVCLMPFSIQFAVFEKLKSWLSRPDRPITASEVRL